MTLEANTGIGVKNHYGARETGRGAGVMKTEGIKNQLSIEITGELCGDETFVEEYVIPAGSLILNAYVDVGEVFVLGGTTPTILVGTDGSEVTNGLVISEAIAEAAGVADLTATLTGTWGAKLAADTTVGITLGGTSPTVTDAGQARLVVEYIPS